MKLEIIEKREKILIEKLKEKIPDFELISIQDHSIFSFKCKQNHLFNRTKDNLLKKMKLFCWECEIEKSNIATQELITKLPSTIIFSKNITLFRVELRCLDCNNVFQRTLNRHINAIICTNCIQNENLKKQLKKQEILEIIKKQEEFKQSKITGVIYKLTFPDNKIYIGQTIDLKNRIKRHIRESKDKRKVSYYTSLGKHLKLHNDQFELTILHKDIPWEQLNDLETQEIKNYDSYNNGLNDTEGGQTGLSTRCNTIKQIYDNNIRKQEEQELLNKAKQTKRQLTNFEKNLKKDLKEFQKTYVEDNVEEELNKIRNSYFRSKKQSEIRKALLNGIKQKTSKYRGVCWDNRLNKWKANIKHNGLKIHIGLYNTEEEAAIAYNQKATLLKGPKAILNNIP